ncbi:MAG: energy transducer TonB, partial [Sediminibacterium sp.]|nr:energy transducer TonB [Sediminibacterium sp.]
MKKIYLFILFFTPFILQAQLNGALILTGKIVGENHEGLPSVSVSIKNTTKGTSTDSTGKFSLIINQKLPFTLVVSSVGFAS